MTAGQFDHQDRFAILDALAVAEGRSWSLGMLASAKLYNDLAARIAMTPSASSLAGEDTWTAARACAAAAEIEVLEGRPVSALGYEQLAERLSGIEAPRDVVNG